MEQAALLSLTRAKQMLSDRVRVVCAMPYALDTTPAQRFRWEQWAPGLREYGVDVEFLPFCTLELRDAYASEDTAAAAFLAMRRWIPWVKEFVAARNADVLVICRNAVLAGPPLVEFAVSLTGVPMVYDFDDAIYLPPDGADSVIRRFLRCDWRVSVLSRRATLVSVGNNVLAEYSRQFNRQVAVWPTTISMTKYPESQHLESACPVLGWSGSQSTGQYFELILPILRELCMETQFRVLVMGAQFDLSGLAGECVPWSPEAEVKTLHRMDVGLMPLPDTPWARGKCALKALQYMAVGVPAVVSDVGVNAEVVPDGKCGFVVRNTEEWKMRLRELLKNPALRKQLGSAGRRHVEKNYSAEVWTPKIAGTLRSLVVK